jgi:hypothetical protein
MSSTAPWTGQGRHILRESWIPEAIRTGIETLIVELEAAPDSQLTGSLGERRRAFAANGTIASDDDRRSLDEVG